MMSKIFSRLAPECGVAEVVEDEELYLRRFVAVSSDDILNATGVLLAVRHSRGEEEGEEEGDPN